MLCLKKIYRDELLQLAILLSILRADYRSDYIEAPAVNVGPSVDSWDVGQPLLSIDTRIHPKAIDSIVARERDLFEELNSLGRYDQLWQDVTAYMGLTNNEPLPSTSSGSPSHPVNDTLFDTKDEVEDLTQEDMDLIEILWKQDVDMGFSMEEWQGSQNTSETDKERIVKQEIIKEQPKTSIKQESEEEKDVDQWAGKSFTIDLETGEYIVKEERSNTPPPELSEEEPPSSLLPEPDFSLEEALELVGLNDGIEELLEQDEGVYEATAEEGEKLKEDETEETTSQLQNELEVFSNMIQAPPHHPRLFQGRVGYSRTGSMEQRWQDLASLLSLPESQQYQQGLHHHVHHHHHHGYPNSVEKPIQMPPSMPEAQPSPYGTTLGSTNVGSAVASSMNLMTNASEPMVGEAAGTTFKMENHHDIMYYQQNSTAEINHNDGFLSSILNDEDLQLMDMAMNEGMYTMRMLESGNGTNANANANAGGDSDSAVSSMGSERVPSLTSDTEWMETNSDSGQTEHYQSDYSSSAFSKYRWYDYGYGRQLSGENSRGGPGVAQKKHHMYGRRFHEQSQVLGPAGSCMTSKMDAPGLTQGIAPHSPYASPPVDVTRGATQPELKYSCSVEFSRQNLGPHGMRSTPAQVVAHNHTYHLSPENLATLQRPLTRDKKSRRTEEEQHLSRDERRARALNIPMTVDDIINLPMDEFNERLSKYDLSENQLSLIRDIRRRGKNKVAAQNCRKRKLDQILSLADEVRQMKERKTRLLHDRQVLLSERHRVKTKVSQLYRHIIGSLRDSDGNPYSPFEWSLQQTADGSVILVPRGNQTLLDQNDPLSMRKPHDRNP